MSVLDSDHKNREGGVKGRGGFGSVQVEEKGSGEKGTTSSKQDWPVAGPRPGEPSFPYLTALDSISLLDRVITLWGFLLLLSWFSSSFVLVL